MAPVAPRHFLRDDDLTPAEQRQVLELALAFRDDRTFRQPLRGPQGVAVLFDKPTLRTQLSFATGIAELGGFPVVVDGRLAQIGVRESVEDTTRVLERQVSAVVWRTYGQDRLEAMAAISRVPVVNAVAPDAIRLAPPLVLTPDQARDVVAFFAGLRLPDDAPTPTTETRD